jgi:pilus assembly protein Flp/PilA
MISRQNVRLNRSPAAHREDSRKTTAPQTAWQRIHRFLVSDHGPTAVEYAVMLMLIFAVCISAVTVIGQTTQDSFSKSANSIGNAMK